MLLTNKQAQNLNSNFNFYEDFRNWFLDNKNYYQANKAKAKKEFRKKFREKYPLATEQEKEKIEQQKKGYNKEKIDWELIFRKQLKDLLKEKEIEVDKKDNLYLVKEEAKAKFLKTRKEEDRIKAFELDCEWKGKKLALGEGVYKELHDNYQEQARRHKKTSDYRLKTVKDLKKEKVELDKKFGDYKAKSRKLLKQRKFEEFAEYTKGHLKKVNQFNSNRFKVNNNKKIKDVYFDYETSCLGRDCYEKGIDGKTICWVAKTDSGEVKYGKKQNKFIEFVENIITQQRRKVVFWAHNGLKFDSQFFAYNLFHKGATRIKDYGIFYNYEESKAIFSDTWLIYQTALGNFAISEEQKLMKQKGKELFNSPEYHKKHRSEVWLAELIRYCKNDVDILEIMVKTLATNKKGSFSGQGFYFFLKYCINFWDFKSWFPNFAEEKFRKKREFVTECFRGGRNLNWNIREAKNLEVWKADMRSAYSHMMVSKNMPIGEGQWSYNGYNNLGIEEQVDEKSKIYDGSEKFLGFYHLKIKKFRMKDEYLAKNLFPLIDYKNHARGQNIPYFGLREGQEYHIVGSELKFLMDYHDCEFEIIKSLVFRTIPGKEIFGKFVDELFPKKAQYQKEYEKAMEEKNYDLAARKEIERAYVKGLLNGVFGKFGQRVKREQEKWVSFGKPIKDKNGNKWIRNPQTKKWEVFDPRYTVSLHPQKKDYWSWVNLGKQETKCFNYVPVAASISAYMRVEINKIAIKNNDNFLQCDTDGAYFIGQPQGVDEGENCGQWEVKPLKTGHWLALNSKWIKITNPTNIDDYYLKHSGIEKDFTQQILQGKKMIERKYFKRGRAKGGRFIDIIQRLPIVENGKMKVVKIKGHANTVSRWDVKSFYPPSKDKEPVIFYHAL